MSSFKLAALNVLKESNRPLTTAEITRVAIENGLITTDGATPGATMSAVVTSDIKRSGKDSIFTRVGRGLYALNPSVSLALTEAVEQELEEVIEEELEERVRSSYTGKAGEFAVASELLFRGWNASIMTVDEGIDIVAEKDDILKYVQVKTANVVQDSVNGALHGDYVFDIRVASFERYNSDNVYYVFVLRNFEDYGDGDVEEARIYIILPFSVLNDFINKGIVKSVGKNTRYRVNIKLRDGGFFFGNVKNDVMRYADNWEVITKSL